MSMHEAAGTLVPGETRIPVNAVNRHRPWWPVVVLTSAGEPFHRSSLDDGRVVMCKRVEIRTARCLVPSRNA